jgi:hypothetical protein
MKCAIQWIDPITKLPTPDDNEAIALAKGSSAIWKYDQTINKFVLNPETDLVAEIEQTTGIPICLAHAERALKELPFWFLFPLPDKPLPERPREYSDIVIASKPTPIVVQAIVRAFPKDAVEIIKSLRAHIADGYFSFVRWGMFIGCEMRDGHIHS